MVTRTTRSGEPTTSGVTRTTRTTPTVTSLPGSYNFGSLFGNLAGTTSNMATILTGSSGSSGTSYSSGGGTTSSGGGGGGTTYRATSSGGGGGSVSSGSWGCPSGATLVRESNGSGNLVCRWNHNGAEFAARPAGGSAAAPAPAAPAPAAPVNAAPVATPTASQWLQSAAADFAQNPQAMLADQLKTKYGDTGGNALYGMLEPYGDALNALYLAQRGTSLESGGADESLAYMEDYWKALQTPGARIDTASALNNIFAAPAGSPLEAYLTTGDPQAQANNTLNLIAGAVNTGYNPLFAKSVMDRLRLERDRYLGESGRNPDVGSFVQYLNANNLGRQRLLG